MGRIGILGRIEMDNAAITMITVSSPKIFPKRRIANVNGFTISEIGLVTRWTPVRNLTFSAEVLYAYLKTNMVGTITGTPSSALPLANTTYTFGNNGTTSLNLRVQRNF